MTYARYIAIITLLIAGSQFSSRIPALAQDLPPMTDTLSSTSTIQEEDTAMSNESMGQGPRSWSFRQPMVTRAGQRITSYLSSMRETIGKGIGIAEEERIRIRAELNKDISYIQQEVISAGKSRTENELNTRIQRIQGYWQEKQNRITYFLGLIVGGKFRSTIEKFRSIEAKFDVLFNRFEANEELIALKDKFTEELDAAEQKYAEARDIFSTIKEPGDHKEQFKQGLGAFQESHVHLKEARRISRELLSRLRGILGVPLSPTTSPPALQP